MGEGKVAVVTGGARGIGRGVALRLRSDGFRVAILDRDEDAGAALVERCPDLFFLPVDVSREVPVREAMHVIAARLGGIDALVNNAGIANALMGPIEELSYEAWRRLLGTNLDGVFLCSKHAVPFLRARRGAIVNIASTRAYQSEPHTEAYAASKGGVLALTHALAMSLGPEVRVNAVSPGWIDVSGLQHPPKPSEVRPIDHRFHPVGRVGRAADVAAAVAFLLSDEAGFITGQSLVVDGGMTRKMIYAE